MLKTEMSASSQKLRLQHQRELNNSLELNISTIDDAIEEVFSCSHGQSFTKSPVSHLHELEDIHAIDNLQITEDPSVLSDFQFTVTLERGHSE